MKNTKKSLVVSIVTLLLCSCMFIGSTFAWFTDTVSNTGNKIQAGTLDVELYTTKATLDNAKISTEGLKTITEGTGEAAVTYYDVSTLGENKPLFNYNLWEPGYSTPAGFAIKNAGNLAIKYELTFFLKDSKTGLENTISDAYNLEHLTKVNANAKLENVIEVYQGETKLGTLKDFLDGKKSFTGHLSAEQTFNTGDLKLLMPTTAGNEYENASISFDIRLLATQYTEEYDGFGSNQYDALADETPDHADWERYKTLASDTKTIKENEDTVFKTNNNIAEDKQGYTEVTIPKEVAAFVAGKDSTIEVETTPILAANNLFTVSADQGAVGAIDLTVKVDGTEVSEFKDSEGAPVEVTVKTFIAKGLTLNSVTNTVGVEYKGTPEEQPTSVSYNSETGELVFTTNHFSQFLINADQVAYVENSNTAYRTLDEAINAAGENATTIAMLKNIKDDFSIDKFSTILESTSYKYYTCYVIPENANITLNLNGHIIGTWNKNSEEASEYIPSGYSISDLVETTTFKNYGDFTITDNTPGKQGMIENLNTGYRTDYAVVSNDGSNLTLKDGTIYCEGTYGVYLDKVSNYLMLGGNAIGGYYALYINGGPTAETASNININGGNVLTKFSEETAEIGHKSDYDWSHMPPTEVFKYYTRKYYLKGYALQTYYNVDVSVNNATIGYVEKIISEEFLNSKIAGITKYQYNNDVSKYGPSTNENTRNDIQITATAISINVNDSQVAKFKVNSTKMMNYEREGNDISVNNFASFDPFDYISDLIYNAEISDGMWTITHK